MAETLVEALRRLNPGWKLGVVRGDDTVSVEPEAPDGLPWCETCKGLRLLRRDLPVHDPEFGKVVRCPDCPPEVAGERKRELLQFAGFNEEQMSKTFKAFKIRPGTQNAYNAAFDWSVAPDGWLVIHGPVGTGKSHLSCAVTNALIDRQQPVHWWYAPDAVGAYQEAFARHEHQVVLASLQKARVLVLDDLGAARATENAIQQFLEPLFNFRERNRLPTLVTCIGTPTDVRVAFSESIGRRFEDRRLCKVVPITADQYKG